MNTLSIQVFDLAHAFEQLFGGVFNFAKKLTRKQRAKKQLNAKQEEVKEQSAGNSPPTLSVGVSEIINVEVKFGG